MPSGDRTGPMGQGPRTGRMLGFCSGNDTPGHTKGFGSGMGRGFGSGRRTGRGMGKEMGRGMGHTLELFRQDIEKRLGELEKDKD